MALEEMDLPRFTGFAPAHWICQAERFFLHYDIGDESERFSYVMVAFDNEPFYWFNSWFRSDFLTWSDFIAAMLIQFYDGDFVDPGPPNSVSAKSAPEVSTLAILKTVARSLGSGGNFGEVPAQSRPKSVSDWDFGPKSACDGDLFGGIPSLVAQLEAIVARSEERWSKHEQLMSTRPLDSRFSEFRETRVMTVDYKKNWAQEQWWAMV
ncbi:hypothetical protein HanRHA438_Chr08g0339811 [Helianthus annuus]|nr:hypothetical protein HanRHA438_Chr08g0339811 [Helianthus annuus]